MVHSPSPLLSQIIDVRNIDEDEGLSITIEATPAQLKAIAAQDELLGLDMLRGHFHLEPEGRLLHVKGRLQADMTRECVVTLEPFKITLNEPISVTFDSKPSLEDKDHDLDEDEPEPFDGEKIDFGLLLLESFELALDPHPRKPGAQFDFSDPSNVSDSPFAALSTLEH